MRAIQCTSLGGSEVLQCVDIPVPEPAPSEVRVEMRAIGINFIDIYHRTGLYPLEVPFIPGLEGSGVVEKVGKGVRSVQVGDRVAFAGVPASYAEYVIAQEDKIVKVPEEVGHDTAASLMLQGMTAHYLLRSTYPLKDGESCLVHAAAGGVGQLLCQIANRRKVKIFGTVSSEQKEQIALAAGCDVVIRYTQEDFAKVILDQTSGEGVDVVYDSVGRTTFARGLEVLRTRGTFVSFGQSSGAIDPFDISTLSKKGSLFLTRPTLFDYIRDRDELASRAADLFRWSVRGELQVRIDSTYPLEDVSSAHEALESRKTSGKLLLKP